jgi:hypothetical protein
MSKSILHGQKKNKKKNTYCAHTDMKCHLEYTHLHKIALYSTLASTGQVYRVISLVVLGSNTTYPDSAKVISQVIYTVQLGCFVIGFTLHLE